MLDSTSLSLFWWAYIAEIAGTIAGFGSSSIFLPIASQILDFRTALLLVAIYHIFGNLSRLRLFYNHWNKTIFILFGIPSVVATILWASLSARVDVGVLKIMLGCALFVFAAYRLFQPAFGTVSGSHRALFWRIGWAASGFSAWLIGTGWVLRWAFLSTFNLPKEQYIATIASIALLVDITRIPVYFGQWFLDRSYLRMVPVLFVIAFVWSWTWRKLIQYIPSHLFARLILCAVMIGSILLIVQWVQH